LPNVLLMGSPQSGPEIPHATFGELLRRHRLAAGLAQDMLAQRARLSVETISALERGVRQKPYLDTIALLADALALSFEDRAELERAAARRSATPLNAAGNGFAALPSLESLPNNLPIARTSFVGREHDVIEIKALLQRHRLLTLVGSGGVGKTRLAIQVGAAVLDRYPDGVWFVDFGPISDPKLVASVVAQALGMSQQQGRPIDDAIPQWLRPKHLLLIFDNCEHVLETTGALADAILAKARNVAILATSRQRLDVQGEAVHRLQSLDVPLVTPELTANAALGYGAVALFVDRAGAADTRFVFTDDNAPIVAGICRRLDGIALAIELAAARMSVLSISNLAQRLDERFKLLAAANRNALPRQKTLSALFDWSYQLLPPEEQMLFARLGIFAGGSISTLRGHSAPAMGSMKTASSIC
jgi:transcriptional regulator with XRE-family HTH domain